MEEFNLHYIRSDSSLATNGPLRAELYRKLPLPPRRQGWQNRGENIIKIASH